MLPVRAIRLQRQDAVALNRQSFDEGEVVYDSTNGTLRLMDGNNVGGKTLANQAWTTANFASLTALTTNNSAINTSLSFKAPIASPTFTGTVTGTFSGPLTGNVTGNVTGNLTGNVTGNAATATSATTATTATSAGKLTTTRNINGVAFDGTADITVTANASTLSGTTLTATVVTSSLTGVGTLVNLSVTGNITAGSNVVISTTPTQKTHATNKQYVDTRALALSVAMS